MSTPTETTGHEPQAEMNGLGASGKIFFVSGESRIPFGDFLRSERERRGLRWDEFEALCGCKVRGYAPLPGAGTRIVYPTEAKLRQIAAALGHDASRFETSGIRKNFEPVPERGSAQYWAQLRILGNAILQKNRLLAAEEQPPQRLSVSIIEAVLTKRWLTVHANDHAMRKQLLDDMHTIPDFQPIELQVQVQEQPESAHALTPLEWYYMLSGMSQYFMQKEWTRRDRLPKGCINFICEFLQDRRKEISAVIGAQNGEADAYVRERTRNSVVHHLRRLLGEMNGPRSRTRPVQGSPEPNGELVSPEAGS